MEKQTNNSTNVETKLSLLEQENAELKAKLAWYEEQFRLNQKQRFGASSEKSPDQLSFFDEAENTVKSDTTEPDMESITYKRRKQVGAREASLAGLPEEVLHYELSDEEKICPSCEGELHDMGCDERREIKIIPAQAIVVKHMTHKYACRKCEKESIATPIIKAKAPKPPIPGSVASASAVAFIMSQKYAEAMPLYRQEKYLAGLGVAISRQTMANWMIGASERWLTPLYNQMKHILAKQDILHADETTLQVLKEDGREAETKSYMWLYRTGQSATPIVLFDYRTTRASKHPRAFLEGFQGYLQTDGYQGYNAIPGIKLAGCWAHARRYFKNAVEASPPDSQQKSFSQEGLDYCNKLFGIEKEMLEKELDLEERFKHRQRHSQKILDDFSVWLKTMRPKVLPKSKLGEAIHYTLGQWPRLCVFLQDARLELSNNRAERSIKPFVIGRKNWIFSASSKGATASSVIYSIIESAKENGLIPFQYLKFLLDELPNLSSLDSSTLVPFLPWSTDLPKTCFSPKSN